MWTSTASSRSLGCRLLGLSLIEALLSAFLSCGMRLSFGTTELKSLLMAFATAVSLLFLAENPPALTNYLYFIRWIGSEPVFNWYSFTGTAKEAGDESKSCIWNDLAGMVFGTFLFKTPVSFDWLRREMVAFLMSSFSWISLTDTEAEPLTSATRWSVFFEWFFRGISGLRARSGLKAVTWYSLSLSFVWLVAERSSIGRSQVWLSCFVYFFFLKLRLIMGLPSLFWTFFYFGWQVWSKILARMTVYCGLGMTAVCICDGYLCFFTAWEASAEWKWTSELFRLFWNTPPLLRFLWL